MYFIQLDLGCRVVGLDYEPTRLSSRLAERGMSLEYGDIRWRSLLAKAGAGHASAIVACTEDDMTNLQITFHARTLNPTVRVVMRIFDTQLRHQLRETFGANGVIYSTSALAAPTFVAAALNRMNMRPVHIGHERQAIVRLQIEAAGLNGVPLSRLQQEEDLTLLLHARADQVNIPPDLETMLQIGDELVVMATEEKLEGLSQKNSEI